MLFHPSAHKKPLRENCHTISTTDLKKYGYLQTTPISHGGILKWSNSSISFEVESNNFLHLRYRFQNQESEWEEKFYSILLCTTPCNFGGKRYWFSCPDCGERVRNVYRHDQSKFVCRHCLNFTYQSRNENTFFRQVGSFMPLPELETYRKTIRTHYKGRTTKTYQRYLRNRNKILRFGKLILEKQT